MWLNTIEYANSESSSLSFCNLCVERQLCIVNRGCAIVTEQQWLDRTNKFRSTWPELPTSFGAKHEYYHTILYEYVLGRTYKLWSIGWALVGLLQPRVPLFNQIFTRTVEKPSDWPEPPPSLGTRHEYYHTILSEYVLERTDKLWSIGWVFVGLGCCSLWFRYFTRS